MKGFFGGDFFWLFFSRRGRLKRLPYLFGYIACIAFFLGIFLLIGLAAGLAKIQLEGFLPYLMALALPFLFFYTWCVSLPVKRLHDLGRSGWWALLQFVPLINIVFFLYLLFKKGASEDQGLPENDPLLPKDFRRRRPWTEAA